MGCVFRFRQRRSFVLPRMAIYCGASGRRGAAEATGAQEKASGAVLHLFADVCDILAASVRATAEHRRAKPGDNYTIVLTLAGNHARESTLVYTTHHRPLTKCRTTGPLAILQHPPALVRAQDQCRSTEGTARTGGPRQRRRGDCRRGDGAGGAWIGRKEGRRDEDGTATATTTTTTSGRESQLRAGIGSEIVSDLEGVGVLGVYQRNTQQARIKSRQGRASF